MRSYRQAVRDIHIIKQQVGLDDELYRDIVEQVTGERSVKGLPLGELENVLVALRRFQSAAGRPPTRKSRDQHASGIASQQRIIPHLMEYLGWDSWRPVSNLCKRITGWDDTRKCSTAELRKVILAMVAMIERNHETGKRTLTHTELFEFRTFTRRTKNPDNGSVPSIAETPHRVLGGSPDSSATQPNQHTAKGEHHVNCQPQPG